ncbi:MAG TPA: hypothetical protein VFC00_28040 [Micromonosporaceae bacterium]|nr:hypothetical protein [Micromonosporaceae bacterium]
MSDFDAVLERLLTDPSFAARLAADRSAALAGYRLDPQELELLSAQVGGDAGGEHIVEVRESKASMFGLLAPLAGAVGFGAASHSGFGAATPPASDGFGSAADAGFGPASDSQGFGAGADASEGFGAAPGTEEDIPDGSLIGGELADLIGQDMPSLGGDTGPQPELPPDPNQMPTGLPTTDYRTKVDVDGDGHWDQHAYRERADGGVDIMVDQNRDGTADWIAIDYDRDGLIEQADWDRDKDGRFETHFFDDDGDGWLDRKVESPDL